VVNNYNRLYRFAKQTSRETHLDRSGETVFLTGVMVSNGVTGTTGDIET